MNLTKKILIGLVTGAIIGLILNIFAPQVFDILDTFIFTPIGRIFLNLISMLVVPIVLFSIILGTAGLGDPKKLGRMGSKTIIYFLITTAIAILIGFALALTIQPGNMGTFNTETADYEAAKAPPVSET